MTVFSFIHLFAVACGGALGAMLRYGLQIALVTSFKLPVATLLANVIGSFAIGCLFVLIEEKHLLSEWLKPLFMTGLLGALTTFSSFSLDTVRLFESGQVGAAFANIILNVLLTIVAAFAGIYLSRSLA